LTGHTLQPVQYQDLNAKDCNPQITCIIMPGSKKKNQLSQNNINLNKLRNWLHLQNVKNIAPILGLRVNSELRTLEAQTNCTMNDTSRMNTLIHQNRPYRNCHHGETPDEPYQQQRPVIAVLHKETKLHTWDCFVWSSYTAEGAEFGIEMRWTWLAG